MTTHTTGKLRQASIYDVLATPREERGTFGLLVLVMRRWPRGLSWRDIDLWLPDAGPSPLLLRDLHTAGIDWNTFLESYRREQLLDWRKAGFYKTGKGQTRGHPSTVSPVEHIRHVLHDHEVVTVLCHERDGQCHRFALLELVCQGEGGPHAVEEGGGPHGQR